MTRWKSPGSNGKIGGQGGITTKSNGSRRSVSFGPFEFDPQTGELRKHGMRLKIQGQPVQVLAMLIERPGEVLARDELQKRLWPGETFVDFEHSLNAAIKRLRAALGDSAQAPRFVETLARRGYRFIAPLTLASVHPVEDVSSIAVPIPVAAPARARGFPSAMAGVAIAAAGLLAALGMVTSGALHTIRDRAISAPIRSLAVLPLANLSGDHEQDYFVDGMTDALRQRLELISSLRVISRTSSMHYRENRKPLPEIARELNVDAVVEGSVLRSGDRVRINVELTHATQDKRLWSNSYEGDLRDIFALQATVAMRIADEIRVALPPPDRARLAVVRPFIPDAYQAYSKGRFYWNKRTEEDLKKAIGFFEQAIDKDPNYALAYDGLADSWIPLGWYGYLSPSDTFPHARSAVMRALALDDSLAAAHTSLAFVKLYSDRDWVGAESEFRRSIELNPNYANGHHWYAEFLSLVGRHKEAITESQRARELDPLSNIINAWVSSRYYFARQYDLAIQEGRNAVEMDVGFAPAHLVLGHAYEQKGMLKEAIAEFEKATRLARGSMYAASLAHAYGIAGRRSAASMVLERLRNMSEREFVSSYDLAIAEVGLRDQNKVFDLLNAAVEERSPRVAFLGVDPRFDELRADPRFMALLRLIGLRS